ncbi:MAG: wax ester/triacylglycerol synthase family O-acyltransferase [Propionibacteriales bacterium]|nr:wax ester/triacylglycerol synthase family O-acyltransferase [Propionibacteriales bacterium]
MDRSHSLDAAFLELDDDQSALHIASVAIFAGPVPSQQKVEAALARRLVLVPRLRQQLMTVPFALGRPVWVDDPDFALTSHLRRTALPEPTDEALHEAVDRILSEHLDHDLPLWEDVVVEGLSRGRWALVTKVHHTMVDGIAGTDLLSTMLDTSARAPSPAPAAPWSPDPRPGLTRLVGDAVKSQSRLRVTELRALPRAAARVARHPRTVAAKALRTGRGLLGLASAAMPTGPSTLVGPLGIDRTYRWSEIDLAEALQVHEQLGGTLNDLVLAVVTRAFRDLLISRGEVPAPHAVRCLVPVSVRRADQRGTFDNQVSALLTTLPIELDDARDRLNEVAVRMRAAKAAHEAEAGEWVTRVADAVPPAALTPFLHLAFRVPHRNLTTVVTNVPGPSERLFLAGRRMLAAYPYVPIADRLRIGVAITSYDDRLLFGVTADLASTPDLGVFVQGLEDGFAELVTLATGKPARTARTDRRTRATRTAR